MRRSSGILTCLPNGSTDYIRAAAETGRPIRQHPLIQITHPDRYLSGPSISIDPQTEFLKIADGWNEIRLTFGLAELSR